MDFGNLAGYLAFPTEWQALTPEFVLLLFALLIPVVGLWDSDRRGLRQMALLGLGASFVFTLLSLTRTELPGRISFDFIEWSARAADANHPLADAFRVTEASQFLKLLFLGSGFLTVLGMGRILKDKAEADWGELYALVLFAVLGMMVVASARELFTLFLGIETASLSSYLMAGFRRDRVGSEAALKYFVIGAISSGAMLFGISLLYAAAGTTTFTGVAAVVSLSHFDAIGLVAAIMVLAGIGFKLSAVPFHAWAPDVYSGAPAPIAGLLASASKAMGFVAVVQVFLVTLWNVKASWQLGIGLVALASMTVGNLVALQQDNIRRMLAYSSIAQAGYLLIAIAVGTTYALGAGILHLWVNAAMKLGAFVIVGGLLLAGVPDQVADWRGLSKRAPLLAFLMVVFLLSMAGLPPLGGFASKFFLFSGAVQASVDGSGWLMVLAVGAVLNSAVSLYYYLRLIRSMYVDEAPTTEKLSVGSGATVAAVVCAAFVVMIGVWPTQFLDLSVAAAKDLLGL